MVGGTVFVSCLFSMGCGWRKWHALKGVCGPLLLRAITPHRVIGSTASCHPRNIYFSPQLDAPGSTPRTASGCLSPECLRRVDTRASRAGRPGALFPYTLHACSHSPAGVQGAPQNQGGWTRATDHQ